MAWSCLLAFVIAPLGKHRGRCWQALVGPDRVCVRHSGPLPPRAHPITDGAKQRSGCGPSHTEVAARTLTIRACQYLPVDWDHGRHNAVQSSNHERGNESHRKVKGSGRNRAPFPDGGKPGKYLNSAEDRDRHAGRAKKAHRHLRHADREHMMQPNSKTHHTRQDRGERDVRIAHDRAPAEYR